MTSLGETLRQQRLERHLEVGDVAQQLKIAVRFLEAIEADKYDKLPGGVFSKSFIRQYASFLGLDGEALAAEFQRATEPTEPPSQFPERSKPDVAEMRVDGYEAWQSTGDRRSSWSSWVTAAVIVIAVMLVCSAVVWWWERPKTPATVTQAVTHPPVTSAPPVTAPAVVPASNPTRPDSSASQTTPPLLPPVTQDAAATQPPVTPASTPTPAPNPNAPVRVTITAGEAVWIRARADGKFVFADTLQAHQSRAVSADAGIELLLGNAGGATITYNGAPVSTEGFPAGIVGPKGQVRTVQFTSGGFQIVPPAPPKAPDRDLR